MDNICHDKKKENKKQKSCDLKRRKQKLRFSLLKNCSFSFGEKSPGEKPHHCLSSDSNKMVFRRDGRCI
jgi:hypothetical protein